MRVTDDPSSAPGPRARSRRKLIPLALAGAVAGLLIALLTGPGAADEPTTAPARPAASAAAQPQPGRSGAPQGRATPAAEPREPTASELLGRFDPLQHQVREGEPVASLGDGYTAELTLAPGLQAHLEQELRDYEVPYGAVVAIEPDTGRVLAYVSHSSANPEAGDLARDPTPPAASVFKIVTGSALVDAGVSSDERVCYGGGASRLTTRDLEDDPSRDKWCNTLSDAMGRSINAIFAKLADRKLDAQTLRRYASAFGFGHALPFDVPTKASPSEVPEGRLERARTAAGFWHMHMSPLHAALIASTIANEGEMPRAAMVERIVGADGEAVHAHEPDTFRRVVPRRTARVVGKMMQRTVSGGTAHKWFFDPRGNAFVPDTDVAGKTGTLTGSQPYRGYNWFVGFAPADAPKIALAALVVNEPRWRIKAGYLAREAFRHYLAHHPPGGDD